MSSWAGNRIHFREKKTVIRPITRQEPVKEPDSLRSEPVLEQVIEPDNLTNDAIICAIALDEERYIDEWIAFHLALGFSHIYLYDNSLTNTLHNKVSQHVTVIHFPGLAKQMEAYNHCITHNKEKHKWCAFIDCDEFIVLKQHGSIIEFLNDYDNRSAIALNWIMFGTSHLVEYQNEPVTKRFMLCSSTINEHIKCICKLYTIHTYSHPHFPVLKDGTIYDTHDQPIVGSFHPDGKDTIACIHHYYTKSQLEFQDKIKRGRADMVQKRSLDELRELHSKNNDVYNSAAWDFYSTHCKTLFL